MARISLVVGLFLCGVAVATSLLLDVMMDSSALQDEIEHGDGADELWTAVEHVVAKRVREGELFDKLEGTPLQMSPVEVREVVHEHADRAHLRAIAVGLHEQLVARVQTDEPRAIEMDLTAVRASLARGLGEALVAKLERLPDCDTGDDIEGAWDAFEGTITGDSGEKILRDLPRCKPVGPLADRIKKQTRKRAREARKKEIVTVLAKDESSTALSIASAAEAMFTGWARLAWAVGVVTLLGLFVITRSKGSPRDRLRAVALGLAILAATFAALALAAWGFVDELVAAMADTPEGQIIGEPVVELLAPPASLRLGIATAATMAIAAICWVISRRR